MILEIEGWDVVLWFAVRDTEAVVEAETRIIWQSQLRYVSSRDMEMKRDKIQRNKYCRPAII